MDWRVKATLQRVFSSVPAGYQLNYLFQRYVTRALPAPKDVFDAMTRVASRYVREYTAVSDRVLSEAVFYEFGAGVDLVVPLTLYSSGVEHQVVIDLRPLVRSVLVRETAAKLRAEPPADAVRTPQAPPADGDSLTSFLERAYGIRYIAPADARATGLDSGSVDCVTSTDTLEHIPPGDIRAILAESRRLIKPDGLIICQIDYQDHFSYFDPSISVYNYLRYSDSEWRRWSPALQFQNRLRHSEYLRLFAESGWEVIRDGAYPVSEEDLALLKGIPLDPLFRRFEPRDLAVRGAMVIARPAT